MEKEKIDTILNALKRQAIEVLHSIKDFQDLWKDLIYKDYARNDFKKFGKWVDLHTSIYHNWKERSNINNKIQQNFKGILKELEIVKVTRKLSNNAITEVNREIQGFLEASKNFKIKKYPIKSLIEYYGRDIDAGETENTQAEEEALSHQNTNFEVSAIGISRGKKQAQGNIFHMLKCFYKNFYSRDEETDSTKILNDLSTMSDHIIAMNASLISFDLPISKMIETVNDNVITINLRESCNADILIESLIQIIPEIQRSLEFIQHEISQNESLAVDLVLRCNPCFLID